MGCDQIPSWVSLGHDRLGGVHFVLSTNGRRHRPSAMSALPRDPLRPLRRPLVVHSPRSFTIGPNGGAFGKLPTVSPCPQLWRPRLHRV